MARDIDVEWGGQGGYDSSIPIRRTVQNQGPDTAGHDNASWSEMWDLIIVGPSSIRLRGADMLVDLQWMPPQEVAQALLVSCRVGSILNQRSSNGGRKTIAKIVVVEINQFLTVAIPIRDALCYPIDLKDTPSIHTGRRIYEEFSTIILLKQQHRYRTQYGTLFFKVSNKGLLTWKMSKCYDLLLLEKKIIQ